MAWSPYDARDYVDFDYVENFCRTLAEAHPQWVQLDVVGQSLRDRPLLLLTLSSQDEHAVGCGRGQRPALWLDAGTHASEWTGISAVLFTVSRWIERLVEGDEELRNWFSRHEVVIMPCISPDGVQAMHDGAPYIRSSLRPPPNDQVRSGLDPCDVDGDGRVRMMRWKHPAGTFVKDDDWAPFLRPRTLDDDPEEAYFLCSEGEFVNWDGVRWRRAPVEFGTDLNRNFPGQWRPQFYYGRHGGPFPLSEPETRAVVDTFADHPHIGCALTMHTYTGCILTQPYREDTPLGKGDIELMEQLATDVVEGTNYDVIRVCPDFMYDPKRPIGGVWADTISTVFGIPGYTIELWSPLDYAELQVDDPLEFLMRPEPDKLRQFLAKFTENPDNFAPWKPYEHPQLGEIEIGGIEYLRTIRNPPTECLADECDRAYIMADRARRSLPEVHAEVEITDLGGDAHRVRLVLENRGFLPTSGLERGAEIHVSPPVSAALELSEGLRVEEPKQRNLDHLDGWGAIRTGWARNVVYAGLPARGHRQFVDWTVHGKGALEIRWHAGRGGCSTQTVEIS